MLFNFITKFKRRITDCPHCGKPVNVTCKLMTALTLYKEKFFKDGFAVIDDVFTTQDIESIIDHISKADTRKPTFRKSNNLFAIRQFLKEVPDACSFILKKLKPLISSIFSSQYLPVKSIYFDKPGSSNWFVSYHQDLTISVKKKTEIEGFGPWTVKQDQFAVQPPLNILENIFTVRIHLDDTDENNGALRVIPKSHLQGICRPETIDKDKSTETIFKVKKGGIMLMKPLLLHASSRTINNKQRRVIHIEFSDQNLPYPLEWSETPNQSLQVTAVWQNTG